MLKKKRLPNEFAKTITADDLKKHLYVLSGKEMEGRETASEGQRKAAMYIENHFRQLNLLPGNKDSFQYNFNLYQDSLLDAKIEINGQAFQLDKDFNPDGNNIQATLRFSELVVVGRNTADSLAQMDLNGKLILMPASTSSSLQVNTVSFQMLRENGVAAILWVTNNYPRTGSADRKFPEVLYSFQPSVEPQHFYISENIARAIIQDYSAVKSQNKQIRKYKANILIEVKKQTHTLQSSNVIGILEGSKINV